MASVVYSPAQQAQLDALQKAAADAQKSLNTALTALNNEWSGSPVQNSTGYSILSWLSEMKKCDTNATITRGANLDVSSIKYDQNLFKSHTCNNRLVALNTALAEYKILQSNYATANSSFNAAQKAVTDYLTTLTHDPNVIAQQQAQEAAITAAGAQRTKTIMYIIIAVVIIVIAYFLLKRTA